MYATMFRVDLRSIPSSYERTRAGRSLSRALGALGGFIAFIALEDGDGEVSGVCICEDLASLEKAEEAAAQWQREQDADSNSNIQAISKGRVIVQQGL